MTTAPALVLDVNDTAPVPFGRLVRVEFRKSYDTRAGFWLLFSIGVITLIAEVIALIVAITQDLDDVSLGTFTAVAAVVTSFLLPVLAIMLVTTEWTQRSAMVTFSLESRRTRVVWSKLLVAFLLSLASVVFAIAVGLVCNAIFAATGGTTEWWNQDVSNGVIGFVISQSLGMLVGFAFAALFLNTAAAIVVYFAFSFVVPTLFGVGLAVFGEHSWFADVRDWLDFSTAQNKLFDLSTMSGAEWAHLLVSSLIWVGIPLVFGLRRILRAEVK
jgi:ABC-2 type transport system permease protein